MTKNVSMQQTTLTTNPKHSPFILKITYNCFSAITYYLFGLLKGASCGRKLYKDYYNFCKK